MQEYLHFKIILIFKKYFNILQSYIILAKFYNK